MRDLQAGLTTWAASGAANLLNLLIGSTNAVAFNQKISDDGNFIAYEVCSNGTGGLLQGLILRYNCQSGFTDLICTNASVPPMSPEGPSPMSFENIHSLDMTPDGRFVTFVANNSGTSNANTAVYLWDALSRSSSLVSADTNGLLTTIAICQSPCVTSNGQCVAFVSSATTLCTNPLSSGFHLYRRDMLAGVTRLVDVDLNGIAAGVSPTTVPSFSADGSLVAFDSDGTNLVLNDRNEAIDVFVGNVTNPTVELVSVRNSALPSQTPDGLSGISQQSVSTNGRYVAFVSEADDLVATGTMGLRNVFVRDLFTGSNILASAATNGIGGSGISMEPAINGNGRFVAFSSFATNLGTQVASNYEQVYLCDLQLGTIGTGQRLSRRPDAGQRRFFVAAH